jgi:hypothetical protein
VAHGPGGGAGGRGGRGGGGEGNCTFLISCKSNQLRVAVTLSYILHRYAYYSLLGRVDKPNPDPDGCKDDEGCEALDEFVVASCDAS